MPTTGAFAFFNGTCTRGIYDNMKTAVETILLAVSAPAGLPSAPCCPREVNVTRPSKSFAPEPLVAGVPRRGYTSAAEPPPCCGWAMQGCGD
jgi:hypothetical protein